MSNFKLKVIDTYYMNGHISPLSSCSLPRNSQAVLLILVYSNQWGHYYPSMPEIALVFTYGTV